MNALGEGCRVVDEYRVQIECFEGPLDLLLHLIEKRELDITAVSLAKVTDQYLEYLAQAEPDPDALADFLVIACKLLVIKSMALFPGQPTTPEQEEIAADLTQRLVEYRAFKQVAERLRQMEETGRHAHPRPPVALPPLPVTLAAGITLDDLLQALARAVSRLPAAPVEVELPRRVFSVTEKAEVILALTAIEGKVSLGTLFAKASCREEAIATFLAVLELLRVRQIEVEQDGLFGDITVAPTPQEEEGHGHEGAGAVDEHIGDHRVTIGDETLMEFI